MNNSVKNLLSLTAAAAILGAGSAQAASFTIDSFDEPKGDVPQFVFVGLTDDGADQIPFSEEPTSGSPFNDSLGGYRDLSLENAGGDIGMATALGIVDGGAGTLAYFNDPGVFSTLKVQWDGQDSSPNLNTTGLGGVDITLGGQLNAIAIKFKSADQQLNATLDVYDLDGNLSQASFTFPQNITNRELFFAFDQQAFDDLGNKSKVLFNNAIDFSNIGAIQLTLTGSPNTALALDTELEFIESIKVQVPEPTVSLLSLTGVSLLGVASNLRRVRRSK